MTGSQFQKGYEFDASGKPQLRPDYDYERIKGMAGTPDANGYQVVTVEVGADETAWNPGSTKYSLRGPAKIEYLIHPSGVTGTILEGEPTRSYHE